MASIWRTDRGCAVADDPDFAVYAYLGNGNSKSKEHDKEGERNAKRDDFLGTERYRIVLLCGVAVCIALTMWADIDIVLLALQFSATVAAAVSGGISL